MLPNNEACIPLISSLENAGPFPENSNCYPYDFLLFCGLYNLI